MIERSFKAFAYESDNVIELSKRNRKDAAHEVECYKGYSRRDCGKNKHEINMIYE